MINVMCLLFREPLMYSKEGRREVFIIKNEKDWLFLVVYIRFGELVIFFYLSTDEYELQQVVLMSTVII